MEKNSSLNDLMRSTLDRVREMADVNTIVGQPITTPDGVTLIPVSRVSFGFGSGGGSYGKTSEGFAGGGAAGVKIDPVAFLTIRDGITRVLPVAAPPLNTVDRVIDAAPDIMTRVENYFDKSRERKAREQEQEAD
ncbi:MAG: sporulation protein YtfJ [Oscillibacter sp.]|nr:sporulation protein YtfJ [Oscillibacter sp.]